MAAPEPPSENSRLALEAFERGREASAAGNRSESVRWFDRACRLAPGDETLSLALASACLGEDDARAAELLASLSARNDVREVWLGLATVRWRLGDAAGAAEALAAALRRHVVDPKFLDLADAIARAAGAVGWCGVASDGTRVVRHVGRGSGSTPSNKGRGDGDGLIGHPTDLVSIEATVGCVDARDGGLAGWAWHPGNPDTCPVLTIRPVRGSRRLRITAHDTAMRIEGGLLARPHGFSVPAEALRGMAGPLHVLGSDGRDLAGSPLDPRAEIDTATAAVAAVAQIYPAGPSRARTNCAAAPAAIPVAVRVPAVRHPVGRRVPADIVVPVYGGTSHVLACLDSVLATVRRPHQVVVIDDASPEPELIRALDSLARRNRIRLVRNARNLGFAASANVGLRLARGRDVVLLNSDTLVSRGWLEDLRAVAYDRPDIGTVTPISNDATILSYPDPLGGNAVPGGAETARIAGMARRANEGVAVDIPVGVGFCMFIRRPCLDEVGLLRADVFAQGYGEENDFCLRARHLGWRHVAAPGVFVAHVGGQSFGDAARGLRARNSSLLERLHPGYTRLIDAYAATDPLAPARRRLDLARWRAARGRSSVSVIIVTHAEGGGVERQVAASVHRHRAVGSRAIVLRPSRTADGARCITVSDGVTAGYPNLRYAMPGESAALRRLLVGERPSSVEMHHMIGHDPSVLELIAGLNVPYDVHVHDYAWLCARVALVGPNHRYCGEPPVAQCEACVADAGNLIDEDISVAALRARSADWLGGARHVYTPSVDTAERMRRYFPAVRAIPRPHEDDGVLPDPSPISAANPCRVCVIGAIGIHKGYQVVLDCARDAAERALPLEFVVVGHTIDDRRLLSTGKAFVTGEFAPEEAISLIRAQRATLAMLPSIWPETWCLSLTEAWRAGLQVAAFDIGAQAERIRRTGRGFLLPLGLRPDAINNALIAASGLSSGGSV